jgi:hypothetical protein
MDVAARLLDVAVPSDSSQRPDIATGFSQPRQKRVPEIVEYERADWLVIVLLRLFVQRLRMQFSSDRESLWTDSPIVLLLIGIRASRTKDSRNQLTYTVIVRIY